MSYKASVEKITQLTKHPKADKLQLTQLYGSQIITDMSAKVGDYYVYFPSDGILYPEFLFDLKLYRKNPETGEKWPGFFNPDGRIKTIKILNEKSDGFIVPLRTVNDWLIKKNLPILPTQDGYEFDSIGSIQLCWKYITQATKKAKTSKQNISKKQIIKSNYFAKHKDTDNFYKWLKSYQDSIFDRIIITEKLHGTSGRFGYLQTEVKINKYFSLFINFILKLLKLPEYKPYKYDYFLGTRNTELTYNKDYSGKDSFRHTLMTSLVGKLLPGEILYFEIVGFKETGQSLFHQNVKETKDKKLIKKFGEQIHYSYGCAPNDSSKPKNKIFIYRITHVNENSKQVRDLSWAEIEKRCEELDLHTVPIISITTGSALNSYKESENLSIFENVYCNLTQLESSLDSSHPREGACIRLEEEDGTVKITKIKTFTFKLLEGLIKDNPNEVDEEEAS